MGKNRELISGPLKYHGGKYFLAQKIIYLMPPHIHYVEPYFGGGAVLFAKNPEGISEVVNDINQHLTNFWQVLQRPTSFDRFHRLCESTPFSEYEYQKANSQLHDMDDDPELAAWQFFICCRQSLAGRMKDFTSISRNRTRRGRNEQVSAWLTAIEGLPEVHARLKRVLILNHDALEVIEQQDGEKTLFYLDPPYLQQTRKSPNVYQYEMTKEQHGQLLDLIKVCQSKIMLSGYRSELYDNALKNWNRHDFDLPNNSAGGKNKRRMVECLWSNF